VTLGGRRLERLIVKEADRGGWEEAGEADCEVTDRGWEEAGEADCGGCGPLMGRDWSY
jgi:hypothetical protein